MPRWQWAKQVLRGRKREVPAPSIHTELRLFTWESKEFFSLPLSRLKPSIYSPHWNPERRHSKAPTPQKHRKFSSASTAPPDLWSCTPKHSCHFPSGQEQRVSAVSPVPGPRRVTRALHLGHPHVPRSCANSFHGRLEHRHTNTVAISAAVLPRCVSFTHNTSTGSLPAHHLCINSRLARSWPNFWAPLLQRVNGGFAAAKRNGLFAQEAFT